jgi:hypothetical protein
MHNIKFQAFSISRLKKVVFCVHIRPNDARIRHEQKAYWPYITKILFWDQPKFNSLLQRPWNAIEQRVRHSIHNIKFQSFSIRGLKKLVFYFHMRPNNARKRHQQKAYRPYIAKILFWARPKFNSILRGPWNAIEQRVRRSIHNIKFQSFSITPLTKLVFYVQIRPNDARISYQQKAYCQ